MKKFLFLGFFQVLLLGLFAQNVDFTASNFPDKSKRELKTAIRQKKMGEKTMKSEDYRRALDFLLKANEFNGKNAQLNYEIATCYEQLGQCVTASRYAEKAYELDPKVADDILYYKGYSHQLKYEFGKAMECYRQYIASGKVTPEGKEKATRRMEECSKSQQSFCRVKMNSHSRFILRFLHLLFAGHHRQLPFGRLRSRHHC